MTAKSYTYMTARNCKAKRMIRLTAEDLLSEELSVETVKIIKSEAKKIAKANKARNEACSASYEVIARSMGYPNFKDMAQIMLEEIAYDYVDEDDNSRIECKVLSYCSELVLMWWEQRIKDLRKKLNGEAVSDDGEDDAEEEGEEEEEASSSAM